MPKIRTAEGDASQYNAPSHHDFGPVNSNGLDDFLSNFLAEPPHVERGKGGQAIKQNPDDVQGVLNLGDIPEGEPVSAGNMGYWGVRPSTLFGAHTKSNKECKRSCCLPHLCNQRRACWA